MPAYRTSVVLYQPLRNTFKVVRVLARQHRHFLAQEQIILTHSTVDTIVYHGLGNTDPGKAFNIFFLRRRRGIALVLFHESGYYPVEFRLRIDVIATPTGWAVEEPGYKG